MYNMFGAIFSSASLGEYEYLKPVVEFLDMIVIPLTAILMVGAAILAICIGVGVAKADSSEKSNEMKKRLWGLMITVFVVIVLVWVLGLVLSNYATIMDYFRSTFNFGAGRGSGTKK